MAHIKPLVCFDLDGTLVDSTDAHISAYQEAFKNNNLPTKTFEQIKEKLGIGVVEVIPILQPGISNRKLKVCIENHSKFLEENMDKIMPIPGVHDALKSLKAKYKVAILSNNIHKDIVKIMKCAGFKVKDFDIIVGADDVEHQKPMPDEIFKAEKLAHEKASFMVGDTVYDIRAGKKANVKTIAVLSGVHNLSRLWAENPTMVVKSVKDLPGILLDYALT